GDMLYMPAGAGFPTRVHGAFVSDAEVHRVVEWLKSLGTPNYVEGVLDAPDELPGAGEPGGAPTGEADPLYDQAVEIVVRNRRASISLVQRHLRIGYNRAARLLEDMERAGTARKPPPVKARPRTVASEGKGASSSPVPAVSAGFTPARISRRSSATAPG